jgi:RND family efflux transporter MFP subunit
MKKIINRKFFLILTIIVCAVVVLAINFYPNTTSTNSETVAVKKVGNQIMADGTVDSQNTAILHFQIGGKLTYLPVKEGDTVYAGQTIASLDTYALQKQLQLAANNYQTVQNSKNQTQESEQAGVLEGQQRTSLDTTNKQGYSSIVETDLIYDNVKRLVNNATLAQNSAQLNVDLANYALSLSSLASPIKGIITHLDVTNVNTNITTSTGFIVADPDNLVFNANVPESMINYIGVGNNVKIKITNGGEITGKVTKIYPQKFTMPDGENGYKVEISAENLTKVAKMGQAGNVLINSSLSKESMIVPSWVVLGKKYVWVLNDNKFILKTISVGKIIGNETEILNGLKASDMVILNPKSIGTKNYKLL